MINCKLLWPGCIIIKTVWIYYNEHAMVHFKESSIFIAADYTPGVAKDQAALTEVRRFLQNQVSGLDFFYLHGFVSRMEG